MIPTTDSTLNCWECLTRTMFHHQLIWTPGENSYVFFQSGSTIVCNYFRRCRCFSDRFSCWSPMGFLCNGRSIPRPISTSIANCCNFQAALLVGFAAFVLARAGLILPRWFRVSRWFVWVAVAFAALSLVLNLITPSTGERAIWAPVAFLLLISSVAVALTRPSDRPVRWIKILLPLNKACSKTLLFQQPATLYEQYLYYSSISVHLLLVIQITQQG